jgi:hypothetical protein
MTKLEQFYEKARGNKWYGYFTVFCRLALAIAYLISGYVKIVGERFAAGLPHNHPLGHYFDALYQTGSYYTFIGVAQIIIALLLLIPRTALLGAISSFPVILNICVLAYATRFEGTRITTLMLLANIYLLCWDYERIKYILPFRRSNTEIRPAKKEALINKFPFVFFGGVFAAAVLVIVINIFIFDIRPGNSMIECKNGCLDSKYPKASNGFCNCIYNQGKALDTCLEEYKQAKEREIKDSLSSTSNK